MSNPTLGMSFGLSRVGRGLTLARLMMLGNKWLIEEVLPNAHAGCPVSPCALCTKLRLLESLQDEAVECCNIAEFALTFGPEPLENVAEEASQRLLSVAMSMMSLVDSEEDSSIFHFNNPRLMQEESSDNGNHFVMSKGSLILKQNLFWCVDVAFLVHRDLAPDDYLDADSPEPPIVDYHSLPVLHQTISGFRVILTELMQHLEQDEHLTKRRHRRLLSEIEKCVDAVVEADIPLYLSTEDDINFQQIWTSNEEVQATWLDTLLTGLCDLTFKLYALLEAGSSSPKTDAVTKLTLNSLQVWINEAEKHQAVTSET